MQSTSTSCLIFALGGVVGFALGYFLSKKKYQKIYEEAAEKVNEELEKHNNPVSTTATEDKNKEEELKETTDSIKESGYTPKTEQSYVQYYSVDAREEDPAYGVMGQPYMITPEAYDENNGYAKISLIYYRGNDILVEVGGYVEDAIDQEEYICKEALDNFGFYEPNIIHVRNDKWRIDYEITDSDEDCQSQK